MAQSIKLQSAKKPRADFPLFPHANGHWAKKVKGRMLYFGPAASDPHGDEALTVWLTEKDYCLLHGSRPPKYSGGLTIADLIDRLLNFKRLAVENKELSPLTFRAWYKTCNMVLKQFGGTRSVESLGPDDFDALFRAQISGKAVNTRNQYITYIRGLFRFAHNEYQRYIAAPLMLGQSFRLAKQPRTARGIKNTGKVFSAQQIQKLLGIVHWRLKAMILLGINCGFGNNDCATLTFDALDLIGGWHNHSRPKTGMARRCPLWPETITAIQRAIKTRREPRDPAHKSLVFLTRHGAPYCRFTDTDRANAGGAVEWYSSLGIIMRRALDRLDMKAGKLSFYGLRHSFETVAGNSKDQIAVDLIMGHVTPGMGTSYRHEIDDERLLAVVNHVHNWLFPASSANS
ncbi:MAG: site-specific integrase [Planctomycetota bacterium]